MDKTGAAPPGGPNRGGPIQQKRQRKILTRFLECLGMQAKKRLRVHSENKPSGTTLIGYRTYGSNFSNLPKKSFRKFRKLTKYYRGIEDS
jgi:hypothetical protein